MYQKILKQFKTGFFLLLPFFIWNTSLFLQQQILFLWLMWICLGLFEPDDSKVTGFDPSQRVILLAAWLSAVISLCAWGFGACTPAGSWTQLAGLIIMVLGFALRVWALRMLDGNFSHTALTTPLQTLTSSGPYRFIRHPAYTGSILLFCGQAIFLGSVPAAALSILMMSLAYHRRVSQEETALQARFETQYTAYQKRTKKFIPFIY